MAAAYPRGLGMKGFSVPSPLSWHERALWLGRLGLRPERSRGAFLGAGGVDLASRDALPPEISLHGAGAHKQWGRMENALCLRFFICRNRSTAGVCDCSAESLANSKCSINGSHRDECYSLHSLHKLFLNAVTVLSPGPVRGQRDKAQFLPSMSSPFKASQTNR